MEIDTEADGSGGEGSNEGVHEDAASVDAPITEVATEDTFAEPNIEQVSGDDELVDAENWVAPAKEKDVVLDENDALEIDLELPEAKAVEAAVDAKSSAKFVEGGGYEVTRPDGTTVKLSKDEMPGRGFQGREWHRELTEQAEKAEASLKQLQETSAREMQALRDEVAAESGQARLDKLIEEKPWIAEGAKKPNLDDFEDVDTYMDARDEWREAGDHWQQKEAAATAQPQEQAQAQEQAAMAEFQRGAASMVAEGAKRFDDFEAVVTGNDKAPFDTYMTSFLMETAEDPAAVFHYLGSNLDKCTEIRSMIGQGNKGINKAIRAVANAEAQLGAPGVPVGAGGTDEKIVLANTQRKTTQAPDPIVPVAGAAPSARTPANEDMDSFLARRSKEFQASL